MLARQRTRQEIIRALSLPTNGSAHCGFPLGRPFLVVDRADCALFSRASSARLITEAGCSKLSAVT